MIKIFKTTDSGVLQISEFEDNSWISMTNPTTEELFSVSSTYKIAPDDLRASLDEEERSRIEIEEYYSLILVDIPTIEERNGKDWYGTIPLAIIICDKAIVTVCLEDSPVLTAFMDGRVRNFYTHMKTRFIFQILYRNATLYLNYLRIIDRRSDAIEQKLHEATVNVISENEVKVMFKVAQAAVTPGQIAVFYDGEICLGGGTIFELI